ncbi:CDP-glycerol:poly(glycerophosphate) glycerophosphotransferase [Stackebrandtia albiflava]|uniref:CDP-glycerol:poly(Glycerophosphate) glycerophosphotransferase n=1 Tax=Stackebrandtia albiflava TaxID=406432 RepID=A0A562V397_9ACTN|nr:CDP-glycerol glycerophosphotransferase family protein [Stackebrandtia albiflava]TWJ12323.1 CDP-glycerol:poly(glycerophosphate) glycerophosphotransferase [Stackebrandtia albiflava]
MRQLVVKLIATAAPYGLPVAAVAAFLLVPNPWPGHVLAAGALLWGWYRYRADGLGEFLPGRVLVVAALLIGIADGGPGRIGVADAIAGTLLVALIGFEPRLVVALSTRRLDSANLPVSRGPGERWMNTRSAYVLISVLTAGFWLTSATGANPWIIATACLVVTAGFGFGTVAAWYLRRRRAHAGDAGVAEAVEAHGPRFAVHFAGPPGSEYQLLMWLPYFARLGDPFLVVVRDRAFLPVLAAATEAPIVVAPGIADVESVLTDSIRAVFYVNNSMQNTQCVRFAELTHIQLMHGDSDKPASYNPISAMYDRIFVAGRAGVDRYHRHGIDIPESRFRIVGHPQAAKVAVVPGPRPADRPPVVLYAPTWTGLSSDVNFCSLPIAARICRAMLERGATVIVRPHPYTRRNPAAARQLDALEQMLAADAQQTGRPHVFGRAATERMSLADCVNAADVMVCDVSGAASEWLYSEKPFAITDMTGAGGKLADEFPLAEAGYAVEADAANIDEVCGLLLDTDPLAETRSRMKRYYMGDFPPDRYEDAFFDAARDCYR